VLPPMRLIRRLYWHVIILSILDINNV
jgi:hypothetical protein